MTTSLVFIDTETTGLDHKVYEPYEVAWAGQEGDPQRMILPHDWRKGDPVALNIGHYFERGIFTEPQAGQAELDRLARQLNNVTLVGSNPTFDANHLSEMFERYRYDPQPWHHRLVNVAEGAMWTFNWDRPKGLADVTKALRQVGFEIPEPDHTAVGDVLTTRAVYFALREMAK